MYTERFQNEKYPKPKTLPILRFRMRDSQPVLNPSLVMNSKSAKPQRKTGKRDRKSQGKAAPPPGGGDVDGKGGGSSVSGPGLVLLLNLSEDHL